jgi:crossover junction endodeoxyribonuclease RuvC
MRVLGIDPGLRRCGFAVLERGDRATHPVTYGTVVTGAGPVATRLAELAERLRIVIRDYTPDVAAIEQVFVNRNLRTVMTVGQASGVALLVAAEAGLLIASYTPTQIKLAVTGTGSAPKSQVGFMVKAMVGLPAPARPADSADAIAVALCHLQHAGAPHPAGAPVSVEEQWLRRAAPTSPSLAGGDGPGSIRTRRALTPLPGDIAAEDPRPAAEDARPADRVPTQDAPAGTHEGAHAAGGGYVATTAEERGRHERGDGDAQEGSAP